MAEQLAILAQRHCGVHLSAHAHRQHLARCSPRLRHGPADVAYHVAPPHVRVLLGPARPWSHHLLDGAGAGRRPALEIQQCDTRALRSDVDPHQQRAPHDQPPVAVETTRPNPALRQAASQHRAGALTGTSVAEPPSAQIQRNPALPSRQCTGQLLSIIVIQKHSRGKSLVLRVL
jgi:hypothetical protein